MTSGSAAPPDTEHRVVSAKPAAVTLASQEIATRETGGNDYYPGWGAMNLIIPFRPGIVPGMTSVSITDLKANLSRHLREVRRGGEIQVLDRGKPIARLVPTQPLTKADKTRDKLIREGVIIPGSDTAANVLDRPPLDLKINLSQALQEDREDRV